ncbi:MAG: gamma-glutamylcyclotransferase [Candidatus Lambdaproteobacteria bacterium]|nr:gamma-glutamylcyclotransferase [Candidatus Lambdaproteobacteria bacterium]
MIWFFGYGSLMFRPEFTYTRREPALLRGYHRCYCSYSVSARGTRETPSLMMNLAPGGECWGIAFGCREGDEAEAASAYLEKREGVGRANRRVLMPVQIGRAAGAPLTATWVFQSITSSPNFCGVQPLARQAELIAAGRGRIGTAYDYLAGVRLELERIGVREPFLEELAEAVENCRRAGIAPPLPRAVATPA